MTACFRRLKGFKRCLGRHIMLFLSWTILEIFKVPWDFMVNRWSNSLLYTMLKGNPQQQWLEICRYHLKWIWPTRHNTIRHFRSAGKTKEQLAWQIFFSALLAKHKQQLFQQYSLLCSQQVFASSGSSSSSVTQDFTATSLGRNLA